MRPRLWLVLGVVLSPGCDVDFVAVEEAKQASLMLRTEHTAVAEATLEVVLPGEGEPPLVLLGSIELRGEEEHGGWRYRATTAVDTLQPRVDLAISAPDELKLSLPFLTRNGAATWRQNGDLELPVVYGGDAQDPQLTWDLVVMLVDSLGNQLVRIDSRAGSLPTPIVLSGTLVPEGTVAAEITARSHARFSEAMYPMAVAIYSTTRIPIAKASP